MVIEKKRIRWSLIAEFIHDEKMAALDREQPNDCDSLLRDLMTTAHDNKEYNASREQRLPYILWTYESHTFAALVQAYTAT